jgi:hypothetical protein
MSLAGLPAVSGATSGVLLEAVRKVQPAEAGILVRSQTIEVDHQGHRMKESEGEGTSTRDPENSHSGASERTGLEWVSVEVMRD